MTELAVVVLVSWLAGVATFAGGVIAKMEGSPDTPAKREMVHAIVAFGGGILVAAVAFALAPKAIRYLSPVMIAVTFAGGGLAFSLFDVWMSRRNGSRAQFMAMLMDFVPEALAMGAVFAHDHGLGVLLAVFIGAQNLPEGFNAYREIISSGATVRGTLTGLLAISLLGPAASSLGYLFLQNHQELTAGIMSFAAGGIMYLIFQDIAPQSRMRKHWKPTLGAVLGFAVGMIASQVIGR